MFAPIKLSTLTIDTPVFAAPLAGVTDWPTRQIIRKCAPTAPILTEMISSHSLVENHVRGNKTNCNRNFDNFAAEGLLGAQIFGADPRIMADAARIVAGQGATWIDINMGCPVPKVATRAGAGAFLMRDHKLAAQIVDAVVRAVKIPVSIKTRLGWDLEHLDSAELVRMAADAGAHFATIHGRTRAAGYSGTADWIGIQKIKQASPIPIVFNGDIKTSADIAAVQKLGADGAMIGRAMLGRPWLIGEIIGGNHDNTAIRLHDLILEHLQLTLSYYGARAGAVLFRKHLAWYAAGRAGVADFRNRINHITDAGEMERAINEFFI